MPRKSSWIHSSAILPSTMRKIAVQTSWTATHKGDFVGIPATGRTVHVPGTGIMRIVGDKIAEAWIQEDFLGIYQQLTAPEGQ